MTPLDPVRLTRSLVDIDSTTGREGEAAEWLAQFLRARGYHVIEQPVTDGRFNVFATLGSSPELVFSTHFDCVPPFFPSREEGAMVFGRGSCDAKGILAAQVAAAERRLAEQASAHASALSEARARADVAAERWAAEQAAHAATADRLDAAQAELVAERAAAAAALETEVLARRDAEAAAVRAREELASAQVRATEAAVAHGAVRDELARLRAERSAAEDLTAMLRTALGTA